ncbi:RNA 2',3'-cyclic phosphodiesterase [Metabacillus arenae]|uniref:RNA 2',3'-cyclic phosphodiesterase n=1 Tax=Metabacillus arenae TaxID=2771434 RepID=A0A926NGN6_9BACI|nr:RNA 2',3'-cyclic phosphodiesterase [Metabacillus arenae]MBD1380188.1 RNA 2',3'-cyclic phosphodiesterase [Metabacillus arenae]
MAQSTHYFLGIHLPKIIRNKLVETLQLFKNDLPFKKWVHQDDLHLTLAFLGHPKSPEHLENLISSMKLRDNNLAPFSLNITHTGTFGRSNSPRIFFAGITRSEQLNLLHNKVYSECIDAGFKLDPRPFSPHITLARGWEGENGFTRQVQLEEELMRQPLSFQVEEFVLFQTHLDRVPKYEVINCFRIFG